MLLIPHLLHDLCCPNQFFCHKINATDNKGPPSLSSDYDLTMLSVGTTTLVMFTAVDNASNMATCEVNITVSGENDQTKCFPPYRMKEKLTAPCHMLLPVQQMKAKTHNFVHMYFQAVKSCTSKILISPLHS